MKKTLFALICAGSCLWAQEGTGPFPAVMEQDPGLPTHTIYRPKDLAALRGQKLPIIAWGEGGCSNNGSFYKSFLGEIASHGYLAIAIGPPQAPRPAGEAGAPPAGRGAGGPGRGPATKSSQLIDAINWAFAENGRQGQPVLQQARYLAGRGDGPLLRRHSGARGGRGSSHQSGRQLERRVLHHASGRRRRGAWKTFPKNSWTNSIRRSSTSQAIRPTSRLPTATTTSAGLLKCPHSAAGKTVSATAGRTLSRTAATLVRSPCRCSTGSSKATKKPARCSWARTAVSARTRSGTFEKKGIN